MKVFGGIYGIAVIGFPAPVDKNHGTPEAL